MTIEATVGLNIDHRSGPVIDSELHVVRWLCADGMWVGGAHNGFLFEVCPTHADPDECDCSGEVSQYFASITTADLA